MAAVWAARVWGARGFQKIVALKVMLPNLVDENQPDYEAMLFDEARIASQIRHPNVVETFDLGEQDGSLFIAMELLEGEALSQLCRHTPEQRLPLPVVLRAGVDACAGLHAAHTLTDERGVALNVVHRDVTPHNLFVTRHGVTKVTDFGIAKAFGKSSEQTRSGVLKGKIPYMPPEQLGGSRPVDARSDVFSLGVSLYQMTTGVHPFRGETIGATVARVLVNSLTPPSGVVAWHYPAELEAVLMRALAPEPDARYSSAEAFGEALDAVGRQGVGLATPRDVAQLLESVAGATLRKRAEALRHALDVVNASADRSAEHSVVSGSSKPPPYHQAGPGALPSFDHREPFASTHPPLERLTPSGALPRPPGPGGAHLTASSVSFHRSVPPGAPPRRRWRAVAVVGALLAPAVALAAAHVRGTPLHFGRFGTWPATATVDAAPEPGPSAALLDAHPADARRQAPADAQAPSSGAPAAGSTQPEPSAQHATTATPGGKEGNKRPRGTPTSPRKNPPAPADAPPANEGDAVPVRDPGF
jgi:serine/threonine-protein kinase